MYNKKGRPDRPAYTRRKKSDPSERACWASAAALKTGICGIHPLPSCAAQCSLTPLLYAMAAALGLALAAARPAICDPWPPQQSALSTLRSAPSPPTSHFQSARSRPGRCAAPQGPPSAGPRVWQALSYRACWAWPGLQQQAFTLAGPISCGCPGARLQPRPPAQRRLPGTNPNP